MSSFSRYLDHNARILLSHVPTVRDGNAEAIHDARVATRRLRAALDVIGPHHGSSRFGEAAELVRKVGRALGRARDIDVSLELLAELEHRATGAAQPIALCRVELLRGRSSARRRMVKKVDALPLDRLPALVATPVPRIDHVLVSRRRDLAREVVEAVDHASGVYFPRRAHSVRISVKKLRYLLELGESDGGSGLKLLRKGQQILGDVQDRHVLYELVAAQRDGDSGIDKDVDALLGTLEAESSMLYERFLEHRTELRAFCGELMTGSHLNRGRAGALLTIGAVAAGSLWQARRARAG